MTTVSEDRPGVVAAAASGVQPMRDVAATTGRRGRFGAWWLAFQVGQSLVTLVAASFLVWFLSSLSRVDPAQRALASRGVRSPTDEQLAGIRQELGLDAGLLERYVTWAGGVLRGDLGESYVTGRPVTQEVLERVGPTFLLAGTALLLVLVSSLTLGLVAAWAGGITDGVVRLLTVSCAAIPSFVVALVLIQVLVVRLGVGVALADGSFAQVVLPASCVAISSVAVPTRVLRGALLDVLDERYALVARGRGGGRLYVLVRHALPNSMIPFLHAMALAAAWMIGGTVVVEAVFNWPGVGSYLVQAVKMGDLPALQAVVLLATASYVLASLVADTGSSLIDPRTRERR
jgi:ABC-type dipeptide/oligopeptide/nickel transport system permease component